MNVVFLDFDGVINTYYWIKDNDGNHKCSLPSSDMGYVNNFQAICWLNELCLEQNLSLVISSTWRQDYSLSELRNILYHSGVDATIPIIGVTPVISENYSRGKEIRHFLKEHPNIEKIVILDDDSYDMFEFYPYVAHCNTYHGFGIPEQRKAIQLLEEQEIYEWKKLEAIEDVKDAKKFTKNFCIIKS